MSNLEINNLPKEYKGIWEKCLPFFESGRPGDDIHAKKTVESVLSYKGGIEFDSEVVIPVAMMHDIGHAAILPEHFKYVTGPEKIPNGKLVHMLAGAKIAKDILESVDYDPQKTKEIVEIISIHDMDQMKNMNLKDIYDTDNKKFFHDIDSLDRYNEERLKNISSIYSDRENLLGILKKFLDLFFFDEFRKIAKDNLEKMKK